MSWRIVPISAVPEAVDALAGWHHAEWGTLMPGWTLESARAELASHLASPVCPTTLVALDPDSAVAGSVSLVIEDAAEFADLSPWLASLYVVPAQRGRGVGRGLVAAMLAHCRHAGIGAVHLFTPAHRDWYQRLGWTSLGLRLLAGRPVELMKRGTESLDSAPIR
jgi:GNAT superfamily N-acetyltransferase